MANPLVTVVCVCYNHERFVEEAIRSVINQTYDNLQIIILDDGSFDNSVEKIKSVATTNRSVEYLLLDKNIGYCKAFNKTLPLIKGEFFIDFAADDVMMPDRIEKQVRKFQSLDGSFGVVFTDAIYIDETGFELRHHYDYLLRKKLIQEIPEGYIYRDLLTTYFIAAPSMMTRTQVIQDLKGYDENLSYEDFDFWIRSSIRYQYAFLNEKLIKIRKLTQSMSTGWYKPGDKQLHSTYLVCRKAQVLNRDEEDKKALAMRLKYELRQSVFSSNYEEAALFYNFLRELRQHSSVDSMLFRLNGLRLPLAPLRSLYHWIRYD
ncbi:MAG TPA: glycosyltransferase family A protein [Chryseosolibacter sp.]